MTRRRVRAAALSALVAATPACAAAALDAPALRAAARLDRSAGLDETGRDLLRREYRLTQALSEQNLQLDALFARILGTETMIVALRAEVDRADALPAAGMLSPAAASASPALAAEQGDLAYWLFGLGASALLFGLAWRHRRAAPAAQPSIAPPTIIEAPETVLAEDRLPTRAAALVPADVDVEKTIVLPARIAPPADSSEADVATVVDLADVLLHHGSIKGAVAALRDFVEEKPASSVRAWLKLLEVYRQAGMPTEFEEAANKVHLHFNVRVPSWEEALSGEPLQSFFEDERPADGVDLEQVPHVMERILAGWGTPDCLEYLRHLLADNRDGERGGFPVAVVTDILMLQDILDCRLAGRI